MRRQIERQLRWCVQSEGPPPTHHFKFLIINDSRGVNRIKQRAVEQLQPTEDMRTLTNGSLNRTGLKYTLLTFISYRPNLDGINWSNIYKGNVRRDDNLMDRQTIDGLPNYVDTLAERI